MPGDYLLPGDEDLRDDIGSPWASATAGKDAITGVALPPSGLIGEGSPEGGETTSTGGALRQIARVFNENKMAVVSLGVIVFMFLFCFVGPLVYHTNQTNAQLALQTSQQAAPPGNGHPLGTDPSGFDILGRLMYGGQSSLEVGIAAALVATIFGVIYGAVSGFIGGWIDALLMRIVDVLLSIPQLFLLICLAVIFTPSKGLLILVIAFAAWLIPARLIRGETLTLRVREYVQAVRIMGGSRSRIVLRHVIPNSIGTIVVNATFQVADAILLLAALGFLGFGVPAPGTDWGSMISDGVQYALSGDWWMIYPAGICIVLVVVAFNYVGDALRDSLEVRLQQR
jgi:peptide/nickel transport system permease protein